MIRTNENARRQPGAGKAKHYADKDSAPKGIKQRTKQLIISIALWGVLPIPAADLLIRYLHLRGE